MSSRRRAEGERGQVSTSRPTVTPDLPAALAGRRRGPWAAAEEGRAHRAPAARALRTACAAAGGHLRGVDGPRGAGVDDAEVRRLADGQRAAWPLRRPMRAGVSDMRVASARQVSARPHGRRDDRDGGLQAGHAGQGGAPLGLLVLQGVRRVVGGDAVDRAVGEPGAQRLDVGCGAQRRVDLEDRVVGAREVVGEQQVVRASPRR
jgi:hypothetical protein